MKTRINVNDANLEIPKLDGGGVPVYFYKEKPFTGIIYKNNDDGSLSWEEEYQEGFQEGWVRYYHKNGRLAEEYKTHNNIVVGPHIEWDDQGNITWQSLD